MQDREAFRVELERPKRHVDVQVPSERAEGRREPSFISAFQNTEALRVKALGDHDQVDVADPVERLRYGEAARDCGRVDPGEGLRRPRDGLEDRSAQCDLAT